MKYLLTPFIQVNDINGKPIAGAKVYVYGSDTTDSVITYQNFDGGLNTDPILTDELGNCTVLVDDDCGLCDVYIYDDNDKFIMSKKYITPGVEGGGSSSSTTVAAGYGIVVTQPIGNVFKVSVDTDIIATQDDLENKQDKLTGGDNIEITQQNVVNVTGRKQINTVAPLYTVESDNQIYFGLNTDAFVSSAVLNDYLTTAQYAIDSGAYLTQDALSGYATKSELSSTSGILSGAVDYISAHCGASYPVSAEEAVQYVTNHSATINEVDLTYQANSGSYITAHQPISSNEWNSNYNTVNSNSANWNSTYETLGSNSGIWNDITVYQNNSANYLTTGDANTISSMFSAAIDYVSANAGQGGVSGDYELSGGYGIKLTDFSADHITRIDVTAGGGVTGEYVPLSSKNCAIGSANTVGDQFTTASNFAQGLKNSAIGYSFAQGAYVYSDSDSLAQGYGVSAYADSIAQGRATSAYLQSIAQGHGVTAFDESIAQGEWTSASVGSIAQGYYSSAEWNSFSQGYKNLASRDSFAQGSGNFASNESFAQGCWNSASLWSFTQGQNNSAINVAQALGLDLKITRGMAIGKYNKTDSAAFVIGQGSNTANRADIFVIYHDGSVSAAGKISANGVELGAGGSSFPMTGTDGTTTYTTDIDSSAIFLTTAQGVAGGTTKFTTKGVQYQAYPSTNVSASWYNIIMGANISSVKLTTAQASYSFTTDEIRHLSQINVATPYTYSGPSTYSVTLGTKTFNNLDSGCYYDFMRAEVEGTESWVIGATGTYSLS